MNVIILLIIVSIIIWIFAKKQKEKQNELKFIEDSKQQGAYKIATGMGEILKEKDYEVSEPKYDIIDISQGYACGILSICENSKLIGEIWFSC
jgi:hypothetical protein